MKRDSRSPVTRCSRIVSVYRWRGAFERMWRWSLADLRTSTSMTGARCPERGRQTHAALPRQSLRCLALCALLLAWCLSAPAAWAAERKDGDGAKDACVGGTSLWVMAKDADVQDPREERPSQQEQQDAHEGASVEADQLRKVALVAIAKDAHALATTGDATSNVLALAAGGLGMGALLCSWVAWRAQANRNCGRHSKRKGGIRG